MAKAKSGGTRSYLRGRIANDVYSIGKDAAGKKQQVVRSLAESVANPQTESQMRGRMIMSTVMQAVSALSPIIDHSFDNVATGQPSLSEFIRRNYKLIKDDVAANPSSGNRFGLVKFQQKTAAGGRYVVSAGKSKITDNFLVQALGEVIISLPAGLTSLAKVIGALKFKAQDYFTLIGLTGTGLGFFDRFRVVSPSDPSVAPSSSNISSIFSIESGSNVGLNPTFEFTAGSEIEDPAITIRYGSSSFSAWGVIGTEYEVGGGFHHTNSSLISATTLPFTADVALPTYPIGEQRFLNGGEI